MSLRAYFATLAPHCVRCSAGEQSPVNQKISVVIRCLFRAGRLLAIGTLRSHRALRPPRNDIFLFLLFSFLLYSCSTPPPSITPPLVSVYSTSATQPWLPEFYACAGASAVISRVDDPSVADVVLRIGEPSFLDSPAFQIDTEEILIVTHRQSPIQNLTLEEARALFAGQGEPSVQVWVYASGEDVQDVFDQVVMAGGRVSPSARLAVNSQQMSDTLVNESNAVGILPRHWKVGDVREVFSVATVPVLAITQSEPQGVIQGLLSCLQNKK